ncbi:hypothetical protein CMI37_32430 [Candidatus Pacearchaeota archaeon]|nr:hypothetical protein [Candidatus Pacearchaeota archaeon]|tara:strand:+ start:1762 stop:2088 length:327 start_codon:yes stop_codon:yes gene_type:complete
MKEENPKSGNWKPEKNAKKKASPPKKAKKTPITMAQKYECAWNKSFYDAPKWIQETVISEPTGRHASDLAKRAASLAESPNFKPKLAKYLGPVEEDVQPEMLSGFFGD